MRTHLLGRASPGAPGRTPAQEAALELAEAWDEGEDEVRAVWSERHDAPPSVIAALVKVDLRCRFARGESPPIAEYLDRFPLLTADPERVVSLIYEEFCLLEEAGRAPDPDDFRDRYARWGDSIASQLRYHRLLSQVAGPPIPPPRFPEPGDYFLQFRLRSLLGRGGEACVYLAEDEDLGGRARALKVSLDRGEEPSIMGRLDHPRIVPVLSVAREADTGLRGLCMPYRPGRSLDEVLRRMEATPPAERSARTLWSASTAEGLLTPPPPGPAWDGFPMHGSYADAVAWVGAALADALAHAHARGVHHRDIKPANVLLTPEGGPQLLDFNLAHEPHNPGHAEAARRGGTLPYMAPEQINAFLDSKRWGHVDQTADLYALGLVLRELLTGRRPEAPSADLPLPRALQDQLDRRREPAEGPRSANPAVSHALEAIVRRCLAPAPAARYAGAASLAADLRHYLAREEHEEAPNPSRSERLGFFLRRHRVGLTTVAAAALIGATSYLLAWKPASSQMVDAGDHLLKRGDYEAASDRYARALELVPNDPEAVTGLAVATRSLARKTLEEVGGEADQEWAIELGRRFADQVERARARGFRPTADDAPEFARAASYLAVSDDLGNVDRARQLATLAERLDPTYWRVAQASGILAMRDEVHAQAMSCFRRATELARRRPPAEDPSKVTASLACQWAGAALKIGRLDEAESALKVALAHVGAHQYRDEQERRIVEAQVEALTGQLLLASHNEIAARLRDPAAMPDPDELAEMAACRAEAEQHIDRAMELDPKNPVAALLRAALERSVR